MLRVLTVVTFVVWSASGSSASAGLDYFCYGNGSLTVTNPDPASYRIAHANNTNGNCTTSFATDYSQVNVHDCEIEVMILVVFSEQTVTSANDAEVLGGGYRYEGFEVFCKNFSSEPTGIFQIGMTPSGDTHTDEPPVYLSFPLTSQMYTDMNFDVEKTVATIAEPIYWLITGSLANYDLRPEECIVYGGETVNHASPEQEKLIERGCSVDSQLVSDFDYYNSSRNVLFAVLKGLRFPSSPYVTIECQILVCNAGAPACDIDCSDRRRRQVTETDETAQTKSVRSTFLVLGEEGGRFYLQPHPSESREIELMEDGYPDSGEIEDVLNPLISSASDLCILHLPLILISIWTALCLSNAV